MPKDFGTWFAEQGPVEEPDDEVYLECGCGLHETVSRKALLNGDTRWYCEDPDSGKGLCCGQFCMP